MSFFIFKKIHSALFNRLSTQIPSSQSLAKVGVFSDSELEICEILVVLSQCSTLWWSLSKIECNFAQTLKKQQHTIWKQMRSYIFQVLINMIIVLINFQRHMKQKTTTTCISFVLKSQKKTSLVLFSSEVTWNNTKLNEVWSLSAINLP